MGHRRITQLPNSNPRLILPINTHVFPEEHFQPLANYREEWEFRIEFGKRRCENARIGIIGCARDIQEQVYKTIFQIEKLGELFQDYRVFIYENDSEDQTATILDVWKTSNPKVTVHSEKINLPRLYDLSTHRFELMAQIRNKTAQFARENFQNFDYICVLDLDLRHGFSLNGILNSMGYFGWWDVITANGIDQQANYYYDLATYYEKDFTESMVEQKPGKPYANIKKGFERPRFYCGEPLKLVASAFGGLAIYRTEVFIKGKYNEKLCDHASFHKSIIDQGYSNIFINPSMVVIR
jgi:hypothetical protein